MRGRSKYPISVSSSTGEGRYKVQPIFEYCILFFRKFTGVPYKHPFPQEFSESCILYTLLFQKPYFFLLSEILINSNSNSWPKILVFNLIFQYLWFLNYSFEQSRASQRSTKKIIFVKFHISFPVILRTLYLINTPSLYLIGTPSLYLITLPPVQYRGERTGCTTSLP